VASSTIIVTMKKMNFMIERSLISLILCKIGIVLKTKLRLKLMSLLKLHLKIYTGKD
jgi:hypothetical protein